VSLCVYAAAAAAATAAAATVTAYPNSYTSVSYRV
jgi:hypothetical protein